MERKCFSLQAKAEKLCGLVTSTCFLSLLECHKKGHKARAKRTDALGGPDMKKIRVLLEAFDGLGISVKKRQIMSANSVGYAISQDIPKLRD